MTPTLIDERAGHRTIADIRADLDLDDALKDAVPQPRCEVRKERSRDRCGVLATWLLVSSCGCSFYYCERDHDDFEANLARGCTPSCTLHRMKPCSVEWRPL